MNKEILQQLLQELTTILCEIEYVKLMPKYDHSKSYKQNQRRLKTTGNSVIRKYKAIEDLINKL
jgi:hypothetical protein